MNAKRVVLFLPPYSGPVLGPPLGLLCLASVLRPAGYEIRLVDGALEHDYLAILAREIPDALCLGISLLTGPMIRAASEASVRAKEIRPNLPVVFGGWHPSLLPDQTLRERFVDIVVRNQGELTFLEVVRRLEYGAGMDGVAGCSFKSENGICHNGGRPVTRIGSLPAPAYDLVDFNAYERACGERKLPYASSVGCPYACSYCTDSVYYDRRFDAHSPGRVVTEVTGLAERHHMSEVAMFDSNFLANPHRAVEIARGFLASGVRFRWTFQASTDLLCRLTDEEVRILGQSGVRHIGFGVESGSERVLHSMNKFHERVSDMFDAARKCGLAGIRATYNLIFGFPGETAGDRAETFALMGAIARKYDNVTFSPNMFAPYPGIPVWDELKRLGVREPDSLAQWGDLALGTNMMPWLSGAELRRIRRSLSFFALSNDFIKASRSPQVSRVHRRLLRAFQRPLHWRLEHNFFRWPVELWLSGVKRRLVPTRSLITGQALGHSLEDAC